MEQDNEDLCEDRLAELFFRHSQHEYDRIKKSGKRFVHYTSADAALNILRKKQVWPRNATVMNDFSEITHGLDCFVRVWESSTGEKLRRVLDQVCAGFSDSLDDWISKIESHLMLETYLTCVSEHQDSENKHGRLSMWRAYGGLNPVAVVINSTPLVTDSNVLHAYTCPVFYASDETFEAKFAAIVMQLENAQEFLCGCDPLAVREYMVQAIRMAVVSTKHLGFVEESEWRIVHSPTFDQSEHVKKDIEVINGVPQRVYKIELKDYSNEGLDGMPIPQLVDRVIVGPSRHPEAVAAALHDALIEAGIGPEEARTRVCVSGIPLRT